jgi:hypothetical protein
MSKNSRKVKTNFEPSAQAQHLVGAVLALRPRDRGWALKTLGIFTEVKEPIQIKKPLKVSPVGVVSGKTKTKVTNVPNPKSKKTEEELTATRALRSAVKAANVAIKLDANKPFLIMKEIGRKSRPVINIDADDIPRELATLAEAIVECQARLNAFRKKPAQVPVPSNDNSTGDTGSGSTPIGVATVQQEAAAAQAAAPLPVVSLPLLSIVGAAAQATDVDSSMSEAAGTSGLSLVPTPKVSFNDVVTDDGAPPFKRKRVEGIEETSLVEDLGLNQDSSGMSSSERRPRRSSLKKPLYVDVVNRPKRGKGKGSK